MKFLVIGGSGFLGGELVRQAVDAEHPVAATSVTRARKVNGVDWHLLDIRDRYGTFDLISTLRPDAVINAGFRQTEWTTTADGAVHVALAAVATNSRLVHVSSDAVFSGNETYYDETQHPDPITPYGAAKAAAETAITAIDPHAVMARTSLIIGDGESSHKTFVQALAAGQKDGVLFTDDRRCPVHVADLASALLELAGSNRCGVHHLAGSDALSRYELGLLIANRDGLPTAELRSGRRVDTSVAGPIDVRLDSTVTQRHLRTQLRGAQEFLTATAGNCPMPSTCVIE